VVGFRERERTIDRSTATSHWGSGNHESEGCVLVNITSCEIPMESMVEGIWWWSLGLGPSRRASTKGASTIGKSQVPWTQTSCHHELRNSDGGFNYGHTEAVVIWFMFQLVGASLWKWRSSQIGGSGVPGTCAPRRCESRMPKAPKPRNLITYLSLSATSYPRVMPTTVFPGPCVPPPGSYTSKPMNSATCIFPIAFPLPHSSKGPLLIPYPHRACQVTPA
jgi:hypothetical protein